MKKIIVIIVLAVFGCIIGYLYYNEQVITAYYRVSVYPPSLYDRNPKVEIHETPQYENDSTAISIEEYTYQYMQERHEKERLKSIEKNHGTEDPVLRRFRDEQRIIIKFV